MSKHKSLLPPNASRQLKAIEQAITPYLSVPNNDLWDPWNCPVDLLPWLASAMQVDDWDSNWSEEIKRRSIANSFLIHKHKGTRYAVEVALASFGFDSVELVEWFEEQEGRLNPGEFLVRISVEQTGVSEKLHAHLTRKINKVKNVRSHLKLVELDLSGRGTTCLGCKNFSGESTEIKPWQSEEIDVTDPCYWGSSYNSTDNLNLYPKDSISMTISDMAPVLVSFFLTEMVIIKPWS